MGDEKKGRWKKLLAKLKTLAPALVGAAGTVAGGPAGAGLASLARMLAAKGGDIDLDDAAGIILDDPELTVQMETLALERERAYLDAETARIQAVNATMIAEAKAEKWWVSGWRPFWGFTAAVAFFAQAGSVAYLVLTDGNPDLISRLSSLSSFWAVPLAILGVSAWTRGKEKIARAEKSESV